MQTGFEQAWREAAADVNGAAFKEPPKCAGCEKLHICGYCPGLFMLEDASLQEPPDYVCRLGDARYNAVMSAQGDIRHDATN